MLPVGCRDGHGDKLNIVNAEMNRLLMIVDPQVDFISGTLPVAGAVGAMDALGAYIRDNVAGYCRIIVTADRHPFGHCSFVANGGTWPRHCVHDSVGAAIWPPVMNVLCECPVPVTVLHKGELAGTEEYSVFQNSECARRIDEMICDHRIEMIDLCGIAGDVCVAATLRDGIERFGTGLFTVLTRFSPSIDGGDALDSLISKYELRCDR